MLENIKRPLEDWWKLSFIMIIFTMAIIFSTALFLEWKNNTKYIKNNKFHISCIWDFESDKYYLNNLNSWIETLPCLFWDKQIPYSRIINWENSWINDLISYLMEYNDDEKNEIFERLNKEIKWQYLRLSLIKELGFEWIKWCDLETWTWICIATFDWLYLMWKYKSDTWIEEFQWWKPSIYCDLKKQYKSNKNDNEYTLLNDWVENCKILYVESWVEYIVWDEFISNEEKYNVLKYIEEEINTMINFVKNKDFFY